MLIHSDDGRSIFVNSDMIASIAFYREGEDARIVYSNGEMTDILQFDDDKLLDGLKRQIDADPKFVSLDGDRQFINFNNVSMVDFYGKGESATAEITFGVRMKQKFTGKDAQAIYQRVFLGA